MLGVCQEEVAWPRHGRVERARGSRRLGPRRHGTPFRPRNDRKDIEMHTTPRSRNLHVAIAAMFALTLLAPSAVAAEEEVAVLAAARALQSGAIIGSLHEEPLLGIVAPGPPPVATVDFGSATGSRPANPVAVTAAEEVAGQTRVLAAQQELLSDDLGSLPADETGSADYLPAALASGTRSESTHLATIVLPD
jgi:hypothetical protein